MGQFVSSLGATALHQGEILTDLIQVQILVETLTGSGEDIELAEKTHPYAIVLTQECDLDWDFKARSSDEDANLRELKLVPNTLLCEVIPDSTLRPRIKGSDIWKRIQRNQDERYHWLPAVEAAEDLEGEGLPPLVADFKRIFTIPTEELYRRLENNLRRRTMLAGPFLHHLSTRFGYYCLRVALPEPVAALPPSQPARTEN